MFGDARCCVSEAEVDERLAVGWEDRHDGSYICCGWRLLGLKVRGCIVVVVNSSRPAETTSRDESDKLIRLSRLTEPQRASRKLFSSRTHAKQYHWAGRRVLEAKQTMVLGIGQGTYARQKLTASAMARIKDYFSMGSVIDGITVPRTSEHWMQCFNTLQSELRARHVTTRKAGPL